MPVRQQRTVRKLDSSKPNTAYTKWISVETVAFGGGSVMVWGCVSYDSKLDLKTVRGNLKGQRYQQEILQARPICVDDNARSHRTRDVTAYLHDESVEHCPGQHVAPIYTR
ncbi:Hypothetical predicted protein [Mytilus galloprovincialis]|uniref:Tc1-like transposase DDE domain-containing protein n=1 Tax=Mytilus galloprovincialis TaxID=29158 RepID=A0A8B6HBN2_MYTGA|nr:Hypothetical predicted protein [Mytilus galloprovincialis]